VLLLSLTVRHGLGDDLRKVRKGVAQACRYLGQGREGVAIRALWDHQIRALETTHGANDWHPHLHLLLLLPAELDAEGIESMRVRISARWQLAVERALGRRHVPDDRHGCDLRPCRDARYLAKLGLELADPDTKQASNGNRSPWEIARDVAQWNHPRDIALWQQFAEGMHGARMLTWSRGLRDAAGLGEEVPDEKLVGDDQGDDVAERVAVLEPAEWSVVCHVPGASAVLLDRVEAAARRARAGGVPLVPEAREAIARYLAELGAVEARAG